MTTIWGLDLGECELAAVKLSLEEGAPEVQDFAFAAIACGTAGRGPGEKRAALLDLVRRLHLRRAVVHAAEAGLASVLRDGTLRPEDLDGTPETVRHHLLELLPGDLGPQEVRYEPRPGPDEGTYRLLSISREDVERAAALLASADLRRSALHSGAQAMAGAVEVLPGTPPAFALLRIGARLSVLAIHESDRLERYRIPVGEEDLAAAVARTVGISTTEAFDRLAEPGDTRAAAEIVAAQRPVLETLRADVLRLLEYHRSRGDTAEIAGLHPVGSVAVRPAVRDVLTAGLPVRPLPSPPDSALRRGERLDRPGFEEALPRLVGALGAALLGRAQREHPLALRHLPPAPEPVRFGLHVAAAAILLFLVFAAWAVAVEDRRAVEAVARTRTRLDERLPVESRSPERLEADHRRIERRAGLLARKVALFDALRGLELLFPEAREGHTQRLGRLVVRDGALEATLVVRLPRDADRVEAADRARVEAHDRIRTRLGSHASVEREITTGGYVLRARWEVAR